MKGLLIKDIRLLLHQKSFFLIMAILAVFFALTQSNQVFVIGYVTYLAMTFVISSISYDDFNNSGAFLFTLPITKSGYVKEKYCFGIMLATTGWLIVNAILFAINLVNQQMPNLDWFLGSVVILLSALIFLALIIPVQLKFGQNRGNIAMILVFGTIAGIGYIMYRISDYLKLDYRWFNQVDSTMLFIVFLIFVVFTEMISLVVSKKIMISKEY